MSSSKPLFTLVFKHHIQVIKTFKETVHNDDKLVRLILEFRYGALPLRSIKSHNKVIRSVSEIVKRTSFKDLKVVCISSLYADTKEKIKFLRQLQAKSSQNLKILSFRWCTLSEEFIFALYQFLKARYEEGQPINHLQLYRLYENDIRGLNSLRVGYILSKSAYFCKDYFITQTHSPTNALFYHLFFTAADFCNRKRLKSYISLGGQYNIPNNTYSKYNSLCPEINIYSNPKDWSQKWNNNWKIGIETLVENGVLNKNVQGDFT